VLRLLESPEPTELELLRQRIEDLEDKLEDALKREQEAIQKLLGSSRATVEIRRQLSPLYGALKQLFGELDKFEDSVPAGNNQPIPSSVYDAWKQRLPPACGRVIDALLVQPMGYGQLKNYCKMGASTLDQALAKLRANNLIEKDGTQNRLKRI